MAIIQSTPDHVLDSETIAKLKTVNSTAVIDILARNGHDPRYIYMPNIRTMNPGVRLVARAITVRFLPARADLMAEKPGGEESPEYAAFELAGPGDVIVMESMRTKLMSIGGDIKFLRLKQRGVDGLVCDGGIRDMHTVKDYGMRYTDTTRLQTSAHASGRRFRRTTPLIAMESWSNPETTSLRTTMEWFAFRDMSHPISPKKRLNTTI